MPSASRAAMPLIELWTLGTPYRSISVIYVSGTTLETSPEGTIIAAAAINDIIKRGCPHPHSASLPDKLGILSEGVYVMLSEIAQDFVDPALHLVEALIQDEAG